MQDPRASLRRQLRGPPRTGCRPAGSSPPCTGTSSPAAWTWRPAPRARPTGPSPAPGSPATAASPTCSPKPPAPVPKFAAVICEDIERSGRDTFNALKLEKKLSRNGIPLFATDEPAHIDGVNATTVLVRRMKQGVAEWFRLQLKEKTWKGLVEHALDGWNIGPAPYGYPADRHPHPVPVKASQGRTKTRLALDPDRAPVVAQIFTWRTVDKLGMPTIAARLNADPARYPAPGRQGWTTQAVYALLRQPQVHRAHGLRPDPQAQRPPRPRPARPVAVVPRAPPPGDRGPGHLGRRPADRRRARHQPRRDRPDRPPGRPRTYPYRGRIRCRDCRRRMSGLPHGRARLYIYYQCPHNPASPGTPPATPDHPRTVKAPETRLDQIIGLFFNEHVFGPGRAALLAAQLPATDAAAAADRDAQAAALAARLKRIETARTPASWNSKNSPPTPATPPPPRCAPGSAPASPSSTPTASSSKPSSPPWPPTTPKAADPTLLDELPLAGDILPGLPPQLKADCSRPSTCRSCGTSPAGQATVFAEITDATLQALPGILDPGRDGYDDTAEDVHGEAAAVEHLFEAPIVHQILP